MKLVTGICKMVQFLFSFIHSTFAEFEIFEIENQSTRNLGLETNGDEKK